MDKEKLQEEFILEFAFGDHSPLHIVRGDEVAKIFEWFWSHLPQTETPQEYNNRLYGDVKKIIKDAGEWNFGGHTEKKVISAGGWDGNEDDKSTIPEEKKCNCAHFRGHISAAWACPVHGYKEFVQTEKKVPKPLEIRHHDAFFTQKVADSMNDIYEKINELINYLTFLQSK